MTFEKYTLEKLFNQDLIINYRTPKVPLYVSVYDVLFGLIKNNELKAGEKIPSEKELAEYLAVARSTVRMALLVLQEDGYITTQQGKGTFVSSKRDDGIIRPEGYGIFVQDVVAAAGKKHSCTYKKYSIVPHEDFLNEKLQVKLDDRIGMLVKVHMVDNIPAVLSQDFFIAKGALAKEKNNDRAEELYENWVRKEFDQVTTVFIPTLSKSRKNLLQVNASALLLMIGHDIFSKGNQIVFSKHYYNTNILKYSLTTSK